VNAGSVPTGSGCTMVCKGNPLQYCGGPVRLNMYKQPPESRVGPSVVPSAGPFSSVGCYTEATTGRALTGGSLANDDMTVEMCASYCGNFTWFGVEYARECTSLTL